MTRPLPAEDFAASEIVIDDCWRRIGTRGDKSCPELTRHTRCRDCPTFSLGAAALLDRAVSEDETQARGSQFTQPRTESKAEVESAVIFRIGAEWFALPTALVDEIVGTRSIRSLPHRRNPALLGLVNVRGELVVCVTIAPLLVGAIPAATAGRLIIVGHPGGRIACPVDEVQHTHHYAPDQLEPVPLTVGRSGSSLTKGLLPWNDRMVARLDEHLLFEALGRSLS